MKKFFATAILSLALVPMTFAQDLRLDITVHIQDYGDRRGTDGEWIGTKGESKRMELINIKKGYPLKAGQLEYDCRYSTMHGMPVTGGRGFRGLKPLWYNGVPP
jgi:hypothetical protein